MPTCRDEILECIRRVTAAKDTPFAIDEIVAGMRAGGTGYAESTIRTHITSRMCADAPDNHAKTYADLDRVERGVYRLRRRPSHRFAPQLNPVQPPLDYNNSALTALRTR